MAARRPSASCWRSGGPGRARATGNAEVDSSIAIEVDLLMHPLRPYGAHRPRPGALPHGRHRLARRQLSRAARRAALGHAGDDRGRADPRADPGLDRDRRAGGGDPGGGARAASPSRSSAAARACTRRSAVAELLQDALRRTGLRTVVEARDALEAALDPRDGGVALGVSHDGGTHATMLALQAARDAGARTALVTHRPDGATAGPAELVVTTPVPTARGATRSPTPPRSSPVPRSAEEHRAAGLDAGRGAGAPRAASSSRPPARPAPRRRSSPAAPRW